MSTEANSIQDGRRNDETTDELYPGVPYESSPSEPHREAFRSLPEEGFPGVPQDSNTETSRDIPGVASSYHSVPYEQSSGSYSNLQAGENRNRDASPVLLDGVPYDSSDGTKAHPGVTIQDSDSAVPSLSEGSFHGIPYQLSESDVRNPPALSSFQEIPYESSHKISEEDTFPGVPDDPSPNNNASEDTTPNEPFESDSSLREGNVGKAFPSLPSDAFPGVPDDPSPNHASDPTPYEAVESDTSLRGGNIREAFPSLPSDAFPSVPDEPSSNVSEDTTPYEPFQSDSSLRGGNVREAFPSLPSDAFPGVPDEPSESESSLRDHPIQPQDVATPPTNEEDLTPTEKETKIGSNQRVQEIFAEIDQIDIGKIKLRPDTTRYLETLNGYLQCFERLQEVYAEVDQDHVLADHKIQGIQRQLPQQSKYGKPVRNIVELYEVATVVLPIYISKVRGLVASVSKDLKSGPEDIQFLLPPGEKKLKERRRAWEKAKKYNTKRKPGAPESWLYDIVRGSVVFENANQLLYFLGRIESDQSIQIVKSKNRFRNPTLSGYRDWNLQIQFSTVINGHIAPHICELQLHHKVIKETDTELGSHRYYEFLREYYDNSTGSLEERLEDLRMISDGGSLNLEFLKEVIQNPVGIERMNRLAILFLDHVNDYRLAMVIANATRESDISNVHTQLGNILNKQGRLEDAMEMYLQDLDIRLEKLGSDHPDLQLAYGNIANVLRDQGRHGEAINMYRISLNIKRAALGRYHADTARSYNGIAHVLFNQGKYEESMAMHREALDIQLKVLGQGHPDTATSYAGLASTSHKQGHFSNALKMCDIALKIRLKALGRDHPDVATIYFNIGNILLEQSKHKGARNAFQQALDIRIKTLGQYHSLTGQVYHSISKTHYSMALVLSKQGRLDEALRLFQQALDIQIKIHGRTHPAAGRIYKTMARILDKQLKREAAERMRQLARRCK